MGRSVDNVVFVLGWLLARCVYIALKDHVHMSSIVIYAHHSDRVSWIRHHLVPGI
jgi:hypothetical protein